MNKRFNFFRNILAATVFLLVSAVFAQAQATRTWVSGVGDDVNPCSRTAPCKTFAGAFSKTAVGGEIDALDEGGFGSLTITKSITIDGTSAMASVLASNTNGFTINAGANDVVTLRGLSINGAGTGLIGVNIISAKTVIIEDCAIFGFLSTSGIGNGHGIVDVRGTAGTNNLFVANTTIRDNLVSGIKINPATGATVNAALTNVRLETKGDGLQVFAGANILIRNSVISGNTGNGISAQEFNGQVEVNVENTVIQNNGMGINASTAFGGTPIVRISNVTVSGNSTGLTGAGIFSFGNNSISGNNAGNAIPAGGGQISQQ